MTDRELLEAAAKAAGYELVWGRLRWGNRDDPCGAEGFFQLTNDRKNFVNERKFWNPLTDDGDALRLMIRLGLVVCVLNEIGFTGVRLPGENPGGKYDETQQHGRDPYAATRRAIVRAAAEIGRNKT